VNPTRTGTFRLGSLETKRTCQVPRHGDRPAVGRVERIGPTGYGSTRRTVLYVCDACYAKAQPLPMPEAPAPVAKAKPTVTITATDDLVIALTQVLASATPNNAAILGALRTQIAEALAA
jgi:hypothetical protein